MVRVFIISMLKFILLNSIPNILTDIDAVIDSVIKHAIKWEAVVSSQKLSWSK